MNTSFVFMYSNNVIIHYNHIMANANLIPNAKYKDTSRGAKYM